jgi:PAS domain S-box-containing protein
VPSAAASPEVLSSASETDYPPFCIVDGDGAVTGFANELLRAAAGAMGLEVTFRTGPWSQVKTLLEDGQVQALPLVGRTPERELVYDFTVPYMSIHGAIVVRKDNTDLQDLEDLRGRKVGVMLGDNAEEYLRREGFSPEIVTTPTFVQSLQALAAGQVDAVVIQHLVALRLIAEHRLTDLRIIEKPLRGFRQDFCFAVREGDRRTLALLNEGLSIVVADGTHRRLRAKWFASLELPTNRRIIVGGDRSFPPFEYLDEDGRPAGYNVDLTRTIARELGLDVEFRMETWSEVVTAFENGEIDILQGMFYTPQRDLKFDFSQPHVANHYIAVTRAGGQAPPGTLDALRGRRLVVERGDVAEEFLVQHGLAENLRLVDGPETALGELAAGKHDVALVGRLVALHAIEKNGWTNLQIGRTSLISLDYCFAVRNGSKALLAQFDEGLRLMEESGELRRIQEKWFGRYREDPPQTYRTVLRESLKFLLPLLAILGLVFLWSWTLRRRVSRKTRELAAVSEKFRSVFEAANVGKSLTLPSGKIQVNQAFADFLGYTRAELEGMTWMELTVEEDIEPTQRILNDVLSGRSDSVRFEKRFLHRNGTALWADVSTTLRRDSGDKPEFFITTIVNINDRKLAEEALRESEEKFRTIYEHMSVGIAQMNLELTIVHANESYCRMLGYLPEELVGKKLPEITHPEVVEENLRLQAQLGRGELDHFRLDKTFVHKDGHPVHGILDANLIRDASGQPMYFLGSVVDISQRRRAEDERKLLEAQLRQAQKMESVGRLAGGVAHDFNNMLGVILGFTELALDRVEETSPLHGDLVEIQNAARRSADITSQLLAFARQQPIAPRALDMNATVLDMLKLLRRLIGEEVVLDIRPGEDLWPVLLDPAQLHQVLANLCINARDAISGVGRILLETHNRSLDEVYCAQHPGARPGDFVLLNVSDDGCGIPPEILEHIFEPFFTTKELHKGTGLGLATVYGIVKQNDGFIRVYSEMDKGTSIQIYLPRHASDENADTAAVEVDIPTGRKETILLVEDESSILKLAKRILEKLDYNVLDASTPGQAIELAQTHKGLLHMMITDVVMPEMNGRELAALLKKQFPALRVLFMSGYTANVISERGVLEEGVHFIQKPFTNRALALKVRQTLDN